MVTDPEKAGLAAQQPIPQNGSGPTIHPALPTAKDGHERSGNEDEVSIHSHSSIETVEPAPQDQEQAPAQRSKSRTSSTRSRALTIVPRSKRRGLLGRFALVPEVERPFDYKRSTKWFITAVVALAAAAAPMGSAIFLPALPGLAKDLNATPTITNLSVALYMLSMSIFPLWWSSFSETLGRRTIYLVSFALFTLWNIISAISTSIGMLIVMRILGGGAAASVQAVGAGTIADIWEVRERGRAMGMFYLGPLLGPLLAPIFGGALSQAWGWRSTQWFQVIYGGLLFITLTFCLPETLPHRVVASSQPADQNTTKSGLTRSSTRQSIQQKTGKVAKVFKRCIIDPLSVLAYLRFPAVLLSVYLASITFGSLYVLNISIQQTFSESPYNFSVIILGLMYIPNALGYTLASLFGGRWTDVIMHREARAANRYDESGKLVFIPEDRLRENAWLAAVMYPGALVWYGWTAEKGVFWVAPVIANFFFGIGSMILFGTITTMLTELMPRRSSSGVAVNNFLSAMDGCLPSWALPAGSALSV
ncbi:MFS general substrate transporter [Venustampulla echinocandica]|uniref:MFS general substrate transporter n=1 Tax=Venustampulla echinocandica TaxID=2656787 RepID=A0A370TR65_9HELO|nr:MFS general substrate transporter [Venustampulla echinocandica]RDL38011.1 MFS general substrate transporter [Venustampulla echinocandica]